MHYFVTYSNEAYVKTKRFAIFCARLFGGFRKFFSYSPEDIDAKFFEAHEDILKEKRGGGLYLWKPYFVLRALESVRDGDWIFYCDAGSFFIRNHKKLLSVSDSDVWVSDLPLLEWQFTKEKVFRTLGAEEFADTNQIQANFIAVRKSAKSLAFVREWLDYCGRYELMSPSDESEREGFVAHRQDQSILSLLCKKHGIRPHLDPSQYGKIPQKYNLQKDGRVFRIPEHERRYPVCLILHRTKDVRFKVCVRQWLCAVLPNRWLKRYGG